MTPSLRAVHVEREKLLKGGILGSIVLESLSGKSM